MKKGLAILLIVSLIMSFSTFGTFAESEDTTVTGQYENFTWDYNKDTKALLIIGYGTIPSYKTEGLGYTDYRSEIEQITIMSLTGNYTIEIGDYAFYQFKSLKSINVPSGVTKIGKRAFERCTSLESFVMPNSVTEVGNDLFAHCTKLSKLVLSTSLTSLPGGIIWNCNSLKTLDIPENIKTLDEDSLSYCYLNTVTIPESITEIPSIAFAGDSELTTVFLPKTIKRIADDAFRSCTKLDTVYYDGTLEQWEAVEIYVANSSWHIVDDCFDNARLHYDFEGSFPVEDGEILYSGTYGGINWSVTSGGLLTISGEGDMPDSPNGLSTPWIQYRDIIKSIVVEEGITRIGNNSFFSEANAKKIIIPDSVTSIGNSAMFGCSSLRIIWIGSGVKEIERLAFSECNNLKTIVFSGTQSNWDSINVLGTYNEILKTADLFVRDSDDQAVIPGGDEEESIADIFTVKGNACTDSIVYSWTSVNNAKKYKVYQAEGKSKNFKVVAVTNRELKSKVLKLKPNMEYKAYVVAYDSHGKKLAQTKTITVKTQKQEIIKVPSIIEKSINNIICLIKNIFWR